MHVRYTPLEPEQAELLLRTATGHADAMVRANLTAVMVRLPLNEAMRREVVAALTGALDHGDPQSFHDFARSAAALRDPGLTRRLRQLAGEHKDRRSLPALRALAEVRDPSGTAELRRLLTAADWRSRLSAVRLLARFGSEDGELRTATTDPNGLVRLTAVLALARCSDPQPLRELLDQLDSGETILTELSELSPDDLATELSELAPLPRPVRELIPHWEDRYGGGAQSGALLGVLELLPARAATTPLPQAGPGQATDRRDEPVSYHGILAIVNGLWFDLLRQDPPLRATDLPPEGLGAVFVDRLLALAAGTDDEAHRTLAGITAVRLAAALGEVYRPDRSHLFRLYRLAGGVAPATSGGTPLEDLAVRMGLLAGQGPVRDIVDELCGFLTHDDPSVVTDAASFLRLAIERTYWGA